MDEMITILWNDMKIQKKTESKNLFKKLGKPEYNRNE